MTMYAIKVSWGIHSIWPTRKAAEVIAKRTFDYEYEIVPVEVREKREV